MVPLPIPIKTRCSKTGSRGDYSSISFRIVCAFTQRDEILRFECVDPVGVSFEIIDQSHRTELELICQFTRIYDPRKIRNPTSPAAHGSRYSKACTLHRYPFCPDEVGDDVGQAPMLLAHIDLLDHTLQLVALSFEGRQPDASRADFTCENHDSIFLHSRPSCSINSSASFGPHVPAA